MHAPKLPTMDSLNIKLLIQKCCYTYTNKITKCVGLYKYLSSLTAYEEYIIYFRIYSHQESPLIHFFFAVRFHTDLFARKQEIVKKKKKQQHVCKGHPFMNRNSQE